MLKTFLISETWHTWWKNSNWTASRYQTRFVARAIDHNSIDYKCINYVLGGHSSKRDSADNFGNWIKHDQRVLAVAWSCRKLSKNVSGHKLEWNEGERTHYWFVASAESYPASGASYADLHRGVAVYRNERQWKERSRNKRAVCPQGEQMTLRGGREVEFLLAQSWRAGSARPPTPGGRKVHFHFVKSSYLCHWVIRRQGSCRKIRRLFLVHLTKGG